MQDWSQQVGYTVSVGQPDLPALAQEVEEAFWRALLRPWPSESGARVAQVAVTARLVSGLYVTAIRLHDRVPFAHSLRVWTRTTQGEVTLLHYHVPADLTEPAFGQEPMGLQPGPTWMASLRQALATLQPPPTTPAYGTPAPPSVPLSSVNFSPLPAPANTPSSPASATPPPPAPGAQDVSRWLRGAPREGGGDTTAAAPPPTPPASRASLPAASESTPPAAQPPEREERIARLAEGYRRGRDEARASMLAARDALIHAWLEAHPEMRGAPQPPSEEQALIQAQAWVARGCPPSWTPEAPQGPAAEQVAGQACQAYDDILRQRGMTEAWSEALRQICAVVYGGHRASGDGARCVRCDAQMDGAQE